MTSLKGLITMFGQLSTVLLLFVFLFLANVVKGQTASGSSAKLVKQIVLHHSGPVAASDQLVKAHIRLKPGQPFNPKTTDEDITSLMGTNFFMNVRVRVEDARDGVIVHYTLIGLPTVMEIRFEGNVGGRKFRGTKLRRKIRSRTGETLNGLRLASDKQILIKEYQKAGYHEASVETQIERNEELGEASVTFQINPGAKVRITEIIFDNANAFSQRELRKVLKTRRRWWLSWLTGSGKFEEEQWYEDLDELVKYYQSEGYIDFKIGEVKFDYPKEDSMIIRLSISEGYQYRVGKVTFEGNVILSDNDIRSGKVTFEQFVRLYMTEGAIFTPQGLVDDVRAITDLYEMDGYLDANVRVSKQSNTDTGEIDLNYIIDEQEQVEVEKIEIRGNTTTKDKVIRRELAINPGEVFDMVSVELSKRRLEGTGLFDNVDTQVERIEELPNKRNLVIGVTEGRTANLMMGFGYGSIMSLYGQVGFTQGNFDLFNPPYFTGGGQKFRLQITAGSRHEDYMVTFEEPYFLDRKLRLSVDLYHRDNRFYSNYFNQKQTGAKLGFSKTLWNDFTYGGVNYTIEKIGIHDRSYYSDILREHDMIQTGLVHPDTLTGNPFDWYYDNDRKDEGEYSELNYDRLVSKLGTFLTYSTLNHGLMPSRGQRTQLSAEIAGGPFGGETEMYRLELESAYYFPGLWQGHVLEVIGRIGVVDNFGESDRVPYFDRFFLGGSYNMRGYDYRDIGPRLQKWKVGREMHEGKEHYGYFVDITRDGELVEANKFIPVNDSPSEFPFNGNQNAVYHPGDGTKWSPVAADGSEPLGGSSYWFSSLEYTIPIIQQLRFAVFYDIGMSYLDPYEFDLGEYADNWGVGLRLQVPMLGPLRLDYGFPLSHPDYAEGSGQFHFGVGYNRSF